MSKVNISECSDNANEEKVQYITDAHKAINDLRSSLLEITVELSKLDVNDTNKMKELKEKQDHLKFKISCNQDIVSMMSASNINSKVESTTVNASAFTNWIKTSVKIPPNLEVFDPSEECSDTFCDLVYEKSYAILTLQHCIS